MIDYAEGSKHARTNSDRLTYSARLIAKDDDGAEPFALFLHYIVYEEMAKALFCKFVELDWVPEDFVKKVFEWHDTKVFLFDEIFSSFAIHDGIAYLGGKKLGNVSLEKFVKKHNQSIKEHRQLTKDCLYVGMDDQGWKVPPVKFETYKKLQQTITQKIEGLNTVIELIDKRYHENRTLLDNFEIITDDEGNFAIRFDEA